ncbi:MAG: AzlC family ABC transporter permease [Bdellovibrionota bacterium]|nr:AzlC family ABC transporter permease [Bdellovibrionota bacterium]
MHPFLRGMIAMSPILLGVIPFGLVMGAACATQNLSLVQILCFNLFVFAGASQFVALELMSQKAAIVVVVLSGVVINLRMLLYSAGISPYLKQTSFFKRMFAAYGITDQSYAVLMANEDKLKTNKETLCFYSGAAFAMAACWQLTVLLGYVFGNIAPASLNLDFAIPLSFVALVLPSMKSRSYYLVGICSAFFSVLLHDLPYSLGLLFSAFISLGLAVFFVLKKGRRL